MLLPCATCSRSSSAAARAARLHPLTQFRSKPAVPIGGKYRLIDVPISNCLHADLRRIFVLTQFNSASLNRHVSSAYRMDLFSRGFVEILAAEQTPAVHGWFQGTADAVRKARRHFIQHEADYYLILAGDHLYRMNYAELLQAHVDSDRPTSPSRRCPWTPADATGMGIFTFDAQGRIAGFEEKPNARAAGADGAEPGRGRRVRRRQTRAARTSRRWASTCSPARCCSSCSSRSRATTSAAS